MRIAFGIVIALYVGVMVGQWIKGKAVDTTMLVMMSSLIAVGGIAAGATPALKTAAKQALEDPAALPYLIELLDSADAELTSLVKDLLRRQLPHLKERDASQFDAAQRGVLAQAALDGTNDIDFRVTVVGALGRIGTPEELRTLDAIATSTDQKEERLRVAALSASADLRLRVSKIIIDKRKEAVQSEFEGQVHRLASSDSENRLSTSSLDDAEPNILGL